MVSKEQNIYGSDNDDERNACAIQHFTGILAKQLLLVGEECKRSRRKRRRFRLRGGRTYFFSDESDDFLSSQESSGTFGGFAVVDEEVNQFEKESNSEESSKKGVSTVTRIHMNGDKKEEGDGKIKKEKEEEDCFLASFTDRLGKCHDAFKYKQRVQSTNGKCYTPAKKCSRIRYK
jgi:hypothetical protein